jgi:hypothetical protein
MSPESRPRHGKPSGRRSRRRQSASSVPSGRYTPPTSTRLRPTWHKGVAGALIIIGAALFFVCEFNVGNIHNFGGHIWYLVGFAIAASSLWWFGAFDRPQRLPTR